MSKKLLPLLIALVFALAGCLGTSNDPDVDEDEVDNDDQDIDNGGDGDNGDGDSSGTGDEAGDGNETSSEPPTASLQPNLTEGDAPLNVTFTLDGTDPDDGDLTWVLDFGDGSDPIEGTELPTDVDHAFESEGNYTVVLDVSDEEYTTQANVTITATSAIPNVVASFEGSTTMPGSPAATSPLNALGCLGFLVGENELDCVFFALEPGHEGLDYTTETDAPALWHAFMSDCSPTADEVEVDSEVEEGTVPEGAGCVVMWNYGLGEASFTLTLYGS